MKDGIRKFAEDMDSKVTNPDGDYSAFTTDAVKIAEMALRAYDGELLRRALDIARAIIDFEDELIRATKER